MSKNLKHAYKFLGEFIQLSEDAGSSLVPERRRGRSTAWCLCTLIVKVTDVFLKNVWVKYTCMVRQHLAGFSCSYWAIFHPVLMQYLRLVQVFFNLTFALITSPVTHRRAELSSPTLNQHKLKYTPYSTVTYVHLFACFLKKMVKLKKMQNAL